MWCRAFAFACLAACGRIGFDATRSQVDGQPASGGDGGSASLASCGVVQPVGAYPVISWDGGGYSVMWYDSSAGLGMYLQHAGTTGALLDAPMLAVPESASGWGGQLAGTAVTWFDAVGQRLDFVLLDASGHEIGAPSVVAGSSTENILYGPPQFAFYVVPISTGYAVVWMGSSNNGTVEQTLLSTADANGVKTGADVSLSGESAFDLIDGLTEHDDELAIVHADGAVVVLDQFDTTGAPIGGEAMIEDDVEATAAIAWSGDRYAVVWRHQNGGTIELTLATYSSTLAQLSGPIVLATAVGSDDFDSAAIAWTGTDFVAGWVMDDGMLQYAHVADDGTAGATTTIAGPMGPLYLTAAGGGGTALLAWTNPGDMGGGIVAVCGP